jgi:hypothetical protein
MGGGVLPPPFVSEQGRFDVSNDVDLIELIAVQQ